MKVQCNECKKNVKALTKEGICPKCYFKKFGTWSKDFMEDSDRKGKTKK